MKAACPSCGCHGSIDLFLTDADAREAAKLLARMPADLGPLLLSYLRLFAPGKRAIAWSRVKRLLEELAAMIDAGQVERHGRAWAAPHVAWREAFTSMLDRRDKLQLPLTNHGYLMEIIAGNQNRAEAVDEEEAQRRARISSSQRAAKSLDDIASNPDTTPRGRATAALASEIARRRRDGEEPMDMRRSKQWLADKQQQFEAESRHGQ